MENETNNGMQPMEIIYSGNTQNDTSKNMVEYTDFQRVDFDNPITIIRYGSDLQNEMKNLMKDIANMKHREEVDSNLLASKIAKIERFSESLDELDEQKAKQLEEANSTLKKIGKFIKENFGKKNEEPETYTEQLDDYTQDLDLIASVMESQKNDKLADISMYSMFIKSMEVFIEKLGYLISVGESDLNNYKTLIDNKRQEAIATQNQSIQYEVTLGDQKIELFSRKLGELRKHLSLSQIRVIEDKSKQNTDMELVLLYDSYITSTVPMMQTQATSIVGVKRQRSEIAQHQQLVEATNNAMTKNSQAIIGNIQRVTELTANGNIKTETIQELAANVKKGIELINQGTKQIIQKRESDDGILSELSRSLEESNRETIGLWNQDNIAFSEGLETHDYPSVKELNPSKPKRFRKLPRIGNGK